MADVISMLRGGRGRGLVLSIGLGMLFEPKSRSTERDSLRAWKRRRSEKKEEGWRRRYKREDRGRVDRNLGDISVEIGKKGGI